MSPLRKLSPQKEDGRISIAVLRKYGATSIQREKGEAIFRQGEMAKAFFIVKRGQVKMTNVSEQGKEFIQGYFADGESFGEPPFFTQESYPASAIASVPSEVWKIERSNFLRLLKENFDIHLQITRALSKRLIYKSIMLSEIAIEEAEHRVRTLLDHLRATLRPVIDQPVLPFSRQQLADMAGLRVETMIRTIKGLEQQGVVKLTKEGKIKLET
jgi:CRP/FNR family transcriptional regulator, cyclic AMP receptor protein